MTLCSQSSDRPANPGLSRYAPEQELQLSHLFSRTARQYRRRQRWAFLLGLGAAGGLGFRFLPLPWQPWWVLGSTLAMVAFSLLITRAEESLVCPGCSRNVALDFGAYCPRCGDGHLQKKWAGCYSAYCPICRGVLSRTSSGRYYRINACTHCGLKLVPAGDGP